MSELADALAAVGSAVGAEPPLDVRASVLSRAFGQAPSTVVAPCTPVDAYLGAAADIRPLLAGGPTELVQHVVGIEELVLRWARGDEVTVADHAAVRSDADLATWARVVDDVAATAELDLSRPVTAYGLSTDVEGLLVLRTFELWTHAQDLTGTVPRTDPARLALMSSRLAAVLPAAMAVRNVRQPGRRARLVLTGSAPGCFDFPLDPGEPADAAAPPDVTIVADVVDVCRLAARRLAADDLAAAFEGDAALGRLVLTAADAFAQD